MLPDKGSSAEFANHVFLSHLDCSDAQFLNAKGKKDRPFSSKKQKMKNYMHGIYKMSSFPPLQCLHVYVQFLDKCDISYE